jgi:3-deoxy-alpha-D-manno-octulosonate 8-oxidase
MTNEASGLKLGMNSDFTVFNQLILDPNLSMTVPRDQYFFTGMDSYIHCVESLDGRYRNPIGDAYSDQTLRLCRQVFDSEDMMSDENRSKLMVASYLGGCAIAMSYVGLVHPLSAALSVVFGFHHCIANCIVMTAMEDHYPAAFSEFSKFCESQNVIPPKGICHGAADSVFARLYQATLIHEKPLINKFGEEFRMKLSEEKVKRLFEAM